MDAGRWKRRSLRRAVALECGVQSDLWDGILDLPATDLSNEGLWLETAYALDPGEEIVVSLLPPGARPGEEVWAMAEVARIGRWRRRVDPWPKGMGLSFTYCSRVDRRFLARSLLHYPPRLPARRRPPPLPPGGQAFRGLERRTAVLGLEDVVFSE
jgi:hypothetical protein